MNGVRTIDSHAHADLQAAIRAMLLLPLPLVFPPAVQPPLSSRAHQTEAAFFLLLRATLQRNGLDIPGPVAALGSMSLARDHSKDQVTLSRFTCGRLQLGADVARACLQLADLGNTRSFQNPNDLAVQELLGLAALVPLGHFKAEAQLSTPTVQLLIKTTEGTSSLWLGDTLITVRLTPAPRLTWKYLAPGMITLLHADLGSVDIPVRRLGLYFGRHGLLHTFETEALFMPGGLDALRHWYRLTLAGRESERPDLSRFVPRPVGSQPPPTPGSRPLRTRADFEQPLGRPDTLAFPTFGAALEHAEGMLGSRIAARLPGRAALLVRCYAALLALSPGGEDPDRAARRALAEVMHLRTALELMPIPAGWRPLRPSELGRIRTDLIYLLNAHPG